MNPAPQQSLAAIFAVALALLILLFWLVVFVLAASILRPWLRGFLSGAPVSVLSILGMRLRGVPPGLIVDALVTLVHRGHANEGPALCRLTESTYLARRGMIESASDLADAVEHQLASEAKSKAG